MMDTIGTKAEEDDSYTTIIILMSTLIACVVLFSILSLAFYLLYNLKVNFKDAHDNDKMLIF